METYGKYGNLWKTMETYGKLWETMETYGKLWKTMETYGKLWKTMENYGKSPSIVNISDISQHVHAQEPADSTRLRH